MQAPDPFHFADRLLDRFGPPDGALRERGRAALKASALACLRLRRRLAEEAPYPATDSAAKARRPIMEEAAGRPPPP